MRWRLLVALLAFGAAAVAGFAWPLLMSTSAQRTQRLVISRTADLDRFASLANQALTAGDTVALGAELRRYTELYGEPLLLVDTRRARVLGSLDVDDPAVRSVIDGALRNQPARPFPELRPWSHDPVLLARPVGTGTRVAGAIVLRVSVSSAASDVARAWAVILGGAVLAAACCTGLAFLVSRWVLRPVRELEDGVRALSSRISARAHVRITGPPELRELETEFNRMSDAVADAAEQQRRLVADASHQLRNPMAALRLRIDTLGTVLNGDETYASALGEVERLESLLDALIALEKADSQPESEAAVCDVGLAIADRIDAWTPAALAAGIVLSGRSPDDLLAACPTDELLEILDITLDNAIKYAGPDACVSVVATGGDPVVITVSDTGPGLGEADRALATNRFWRAPHHKSQRGNGLGLSIAAAHLTRRAGALRLTPTHPTGLTVHIELPPAAP